MKSEYTYLLDTNILAALARNPQGSVYRAIKERGPETLCTSVIVAGEIEYGLRKKNAARLCRQMESILSHVPVLGLDPDVAQSYGRLRQNLASRGLLIGPNDLWIAAHALVLGLTLVTANTIEFRRVASLRLADWSR
ncbi:MAG: type II toxin-antitoxin system VapC family toxin [Opitutales bacterium]